MPTAPALRSVLVVAILAAGLVAVPAPARAQIPVVCDESSLVTATNTAGGDTLALAPFRTHTLIHAHGSPPDGPTGLPVTAPITMAGIGTTITPAPSAPACRILEIDGDANAPGTAGRLHPIAVTIRGGSAVAPYPNGGIYTDNGTVSLTSSTVTGNTATSSGSGFYKNSGAVNQLASDVSRNTPDNCTPSGSVPRCAG